MDPKVWYKSKEAWLNLAAITSLALTLPEVGELVPGSAARYIGALNAILILVLRFTGNGSAPLTLRKGIGQ
jgi:hypothetical protein